MHKTLKKHEVLRGRAHFQRIFKQGKKVEGKFLRCLMLPKELSVTDQRGNVVVGFAVAAHFVADEPLEDDHFLL